MSSPAVVLRWLAIPLNVACVAALCALAASVVINNTGATCIDQVGGACVENWHIGLIEWVVYAALLSGTLIATVSTGWIAPAAKRVTTAVVALLICAAAIALFVLTRWQEIVGPVLVICAAAMFGVAWSWRRVPSERESE